MTPETLAARNRAAALSKHRGPDHPSVREARAHLAELQLAEKITATPLSPEQRSRLAALLLAGGPR